MSIESVYENRMRDSNSFNGYNKNEKASKEKLLETAFKVGDKVYVQDDKGVVYLEGIVISLIKNMHIEGTIVKYSNYIRYPVGTKDIFVMCRDGKRNLNGEDFITVKQEIK
jgi:hypothetical protein